MNEIERKLKEGYVLDLKKPRIDKFERATIIREVLKEKGWSIRRLAREWGFSKSTVEDWLLYNNIDEKTYNELIAKGNTPTSIYRELRKTRGEEKPSFTNLDLRIKTILQDIQRLKNSFSHSVQSRDLIDKLINELNIIKMNINLKEKGKL